MRSRRAARQAANTSATTHEIRRMAGLLVFPPTHPPLNQLRGFRPTDGGEVMILLLNRSPASQHRTCVTKCSQGLGPLCQTVLHYPSCSTATWALSVPEHPAISDVQFGIVLASLKMALGCNPELACYGTWHV